MGATRTRSSEDRPTIDAPATGIVSTIVNGQEMPLSEADFWVFEDSTYVVRSREFDFSAEGEDMTSALAAFGDRVYEYADMLQHLYESGEATEAEREALKTLSQRLSKIYLAERRQLDSPRGLFRRRRSRPASRSSWRDIVTVATAK